MVTKAVKLRPAYVWMCDGCGFDQFERAVAYDGPTPCAKCLHAEDEHDWDGDGLSTCRHAGCECWAFAAPEDGVFLVAPACVQCSLCGAEFEATAR